MARADASVGINGISLNNVSADPWMLAPMYIDKMAALADVLRPYGIRLYVAAKFSAPVELGKLKTADPADPQVQAWWKKEVDAIYRRIPDFGGFVVKANSEGQPGPRDYDRSQAEGANVIADALAPHGGTVFWRAFVYSEKDPVDRAKQAYNEFKPLDGKFRDNVFVQVKNGAIDFQPREPAHPLFGAMPKTNLALEVQLTKEYLGQATHLVYLPELFKEVLDWDTLAKGKGSTVAKVIDGSLEGHRSSAMVGVSNIGDDRNWTGAQFSQADWYGFGRLAWDPGLIAEQIAREWLGMTFTNDPSFRECRGADDDREPRGGGGLHDAAGAASSDGDGPSLWARALGQRSAAAGTESGLFPSRRCARGLALTARPPAATPPRNMPRRWPSCFPVPIFRIVICFGFSMSPGTTK